METTVELTMIQSTNSRQQGLIAKLDHYCSIFSQFETSYLPVLCRLVCDRAARLKDQDRCLTQHDLQEIDLLLQGVKKSPLISRAYFEQLQRNPVAHVEEAPDPWLIEAPGLLEKVVQPDARVNRTTYLAALDYYGLPRDFRVIMPAGPGRLQYSTVGGAAQQDQPAWVVVNRTIKKFRGIKPTVDDIWSVQTITLDFEYPADPLRCHAVGVELAYWLQQSGYSDATQPISVEDSGAGCHIALPIVPIVCRDHGGPALVNEAIREVVLTLFKPAFDRIARRYRFGPDDLKLEAFDIARIFSLPGMWRPGGRKPNEAQHLLPGYQRRWLAPFQASYPIRVESQILSEVIKAKCLELQARGPASLGDVERPAPSHPTVELPGQARPVVVEQWIRGYADRNPPKVQRKSGQGFDRSAYFHSLVMAVRLKFGDQGDAIAHEQADLINELAGRKYRDATREVERSLRRA